MTRPRRQFREIEVLETLIVHQGVAIPCFRCGVAFTADDVKRGNIEKEHLHERGLDGPDEPFNCRYSHKSEPCHHTVTNGPPATSAGSSKHRIAKAKRLATETAMHRAVMAGDLTRTKASALGGRGFVKAHRPMPGSRNSPWRRPFNGRVERR